MSLDSCGKKLEVIKTLFYLIGKKKAWHVGATVKPRLHTQELKLDRLAVRDWANGSDVPLLGLCLTS